MSVRAPPLPELKATGCEGQSLQRSESTIVSLFLMKIQRCLASFLFTEEVLQVVVRRFGSE